MLISTLIGGAVTIGGVAMSSQDIVHSAQSAANSLNTHQIATVLELYYSDHQRYPMAINTEKLIDELVGQDYLHTRPIDESIFHYTSKSNGQDYSLTLNQ
ncbi:MAG: hypothetical protein Q8R40_05465 [bacterium]|nr:hypothetical protein [bacterium]